MSSKRQPQQPTTFREYKPGVYVGPLKDERKFVHVCWNVDKEDASLKGHVHVAFPEGSQCYLPVGHVRPMRTQEWFFEGEQARKEAVIGLSKILAQFGNFLYPNVDPDGRPIQALGFLISAFCAFDGAEMLRVMAVALDDASLHEEAKACNAAAAVLEARQAEVIPASLPEVS
jgi:hypothetical protein